MTKFTLLLGLLMYCIISNAQPCPDNITFTSQAQIDSFPLLYPTCTSISGNVTIQGANIVNLNALAQITAIGGSFQILNNPALTGLSGMAGLSNVSSIFIQNNPSLTSVTAFNSLSTIGYLFIDGNPVLTSLTGINALTTIGGITISNNAALNNISGLGALSSIAGYFDVQNNAALTSLNGLNALASIGGLNVTNNASLTSLSGLSALTTTGGLNISNNPALTSIAGLSALTSAGSYLNIFNNPALSVCNIESVCNYLSVPANNANIYGNATGCASMAQVQTACGIPVTCPVNIAFTTQSEIDLFSATYPGCTTITGNVTIQGPGITNLGGLAQLTEIGGNFEINNTALTNLAGLNAVTAVGGVFLLEYNPNLHNLNGLNALNTTGALRILFNDALVSLSGFPALTTIDENLEIYNNPSLTNLPGINALTNIGGNLEIYNNAALAHLTGFNSLSTVSGLLRIEYNSHLPSLTGLNALTSIGGLAINNNAVLASCEAQALCTYLTTPSNPATISGNAPGCNNRTEVEIACGILFYQDLDGDGFGNPAVTTIASSQPSGYVPVNTDCNDGNAAVHPGATEICNSIDDNCNGQIDEVLSGCTTPLNPAQSNVQAYTADLSWSPVTCATQYRIQYRVLGAPSFTNGPIVNIPNVTVNLGGLQASTHYQWRVRAICYNGSSTANTSPMDLITLPPPVPWYRDADGDGYGDPAVSISASLQPAGYVSNNTDCNDTPGLIGASVYPGAPERCDNLDNNCNGQIDEGVPMGACPVPAGLASSEITYHSARVRWTRTECVASYKVQYRVLGASAYTNGPTINFPDTTAILEGLLESTNYQWRVRSVCFNGSSSLSSQPQPFTTPSSLPTWYGDEDGDGFGNPASSIMASVQPLGYVSLNTDCDDGKVDIHPGAPEYCNGMDDDCDGLIDEQALDCPTPTGQSETNITATKARLNWLTTSCATTYNVQYRVRGTTTWSSRIVDNLFLQLNNLTPGTQYEWRVRAKCGLYFSPFTIPILRFTTLTSLVAADHDRMETSDYTAPKSGLTDLLPHFAIHPNPGSGLFNLRVQSLHDETVMIRVIDQMGTARYSQYIAVEQGETRMPVDLTGLASGLYYLECMSEGKVWVEKIVIW